MVGFQLFQLRADRQEDFKWWQREQVCQEQNAMRREQRLSEGAIWIERFAFTKFPVVVADVILNSKYFTSWIY